MTTLKIMVWASEEEDDYTEFPDLSSADRYMVIAMLEALDMPYEPLTMPVLAPNESIFCITEDCAGTFQMFLCENLDDISQVFNAIESGDTWNWFQGNLHDLILPFNS